MERLRPHQPKASLPIVNPSPFRDDAYNAHRKRQKLPIANERVMRNIRVGHARNCQREYGKEGQLSTKEASLAEVMIISTLTWRQIKFNHGQSNRDLCLPTLVDLLISNMIQLCRLY